MTSHLFRLTSLVAAVVVVLIASAPGISVPPGGEALTSETFELQYGSALGLMPLLVDDQAEVKFRKEPDVSKGKVVRRVLSLGPWRTGDTSASRFGIMWVSETRKLYVDRNQNFDLTDDAESPIRASDSRGVDMFEFDLRVTSGGLTLPSHVRVSFIGDWCDPKVTSGWSREATLGGEKVKLEVMDVGLPGLDSSDSLSISSGRGKATKAFNFPDELFFGGRLYELDWQYVPSGAAPDLMLTFQEKRVPMAELRLEGIAERLVLTDASHHRTAVFDKPSTSAAVAIPAGEYASATVYLDSGSVGTKRVKLVAAEGAPLSLKMGGPLTSEATVVAHGNVLNLDRRVRGVGGEEYRGAAASPDSVQFSIYKGSIRLLRGQFAFG